MEGEGQAEVQVGGWDGGETEAGFGGVLEVRADVREEYEGHGYGLVVSGLALRPAWAQG